MGLAEPKKRIKISQDPNNLNWAHAADSFGQRLLASQGWRPGQGLGARKANSNSSPLPSVRVKYKDDNLGLGACLKSADVGRTRTGLDGFQSLLGRLNSKTEDEAKELEKLSENRKLALWTQGKWGGVIFVSGGLLGGDERPEMKQKSQLSEKLSPRMADAFDEKATRKAARKTERALRKAEKRKLKKPEFNTVAGVTPPSSGSTTRMSEGSKSKYEQFRKNHAETRLSGIEERWSSGMDSGDGVKDNRKRHKRHKRKRDSDQNERPSRMKTPVEVVLGPANDAAQLPTTPSSSLLEHLPQQGVKPDSRAGRYLVRGRNIQAKKMAFANDKMLDEIFMKRLS